MNAKRLILLAGGLLVGVALGLVILFGFSGAGSPHASLGIAAQDSPRAGQAAPDFTLTDLAGKDVSLSQFKGQAVMINFWATWCGPCKVEMPLLQERSTRYAPDLVVLGVNYDEPRDLVANYVTELGLSFPILLDPGGKVNAAYLVQGYPTTLFVDRDGVIQAVHIGQLDGRLLDQYLAAIGVK